jgi:DNA-binding response OmpR family regulator
MPKVLIADDEPELLELLRFSLDADGFEVVTASDGKKALDLSRREKFDVIILDVMMPHMDGYHVAAAITEQLGAPPVLLLTSRDFSQDQAAIKGSGANAFLSKPFEITELLQVVRDLISEPS